MQLCKDLGADEIIDYRNSDVASALSKSGKPYDFVLDNIGTNFALYWKSPTFTKTGAKYVQIGSEANVSSMYDLAFRFLVPQSLGGGQRPFSFGMTSTNFEHFTKIAQLVADGKLKPVIDEVFAFEDAPKAYKKLKTGRTKGKLVVRVGSSHER
jgi:NADPH:quinone reductase-like Zn-dependent oxidoreductase